MPTSPEPSTPERADEPTEQLNGPLTDRWWWSGAFRMIAGGGVVAYQVPVLQAEPFALTYVMVALGAAVAVWGVLVLRTDYAIHRDAGSVEDGDAEQS